MRCIRCAVDKDLNEFHKDKAFKSGYKSSCKTCLKNKVPIPDKSLVSEKLCSDCNIIKPLGEFHIDRNGKYGRRQWCKECWKVRIEPTKNERRVRNKKWRENNLEKHRSDVRFLSYKNLGLDITREQYYQMLADQKGLCAICERSPKPGTSLCLDHCHSTGKIRKLLCRDCNLALGKFQDNYQSILKAAEYILTFQN